MRRGGEGRGHEAGKGERALRLGVRALFEQSLHATGDHTASLQQECLCLPLRERGTGQAWNRAPRRWPWSRHGGRWGCQGEGRQTRCTSTNTEPLHTAVIIAPHRAERPLYIGDRTMSCSTLALSLVCHCVFTHLEVDQGHVQQPAVGGVQLPYRRHAVLQRGVQTRAVLGCGGAQSTRHRHVARGGQGGAQGAGMSRGTGTSRGRSLARR